MRFKRKRFPYQEDSKRDWSFYSKKMRSRLVDDGALKNEEDGFMLGYEEGLLG